MYSNVSYSSEIRIRKKFTYFSKEISIHSWRVSKVQSAVQLRNIISLRVYYTNILLFMFITWTLMFFYDKIRIFVRVQSSSFLQFWKPRKGQRIWYFLPAIYRLESKKDCKHNLQPYLFVFPVVIKVINPKLEHDWDDGDK